MAVVFTPFKPEVDRRIARRRRRPDFQGRHHDVHAKRGGIKAGCLNVGSHCSSYSSGWMYMNPDIEAQAAPDGPPHPSQQCGHAPSGPQGGGGDGSIPSILLAEMKSKEVVSSARTATSPGWGCFSPVVLPPKVAFTRARFHDDPTRQSEDDGDDAGRAYRFDVPARLGKQTPGGSPRAREQATALSSALRDILYGTRSRPQSGRATLAKNAKDTVANEKDRVPPLTSGARMGLDVISSLEGMVADEGEVFDSCFRELVRQERCACRQRGDLMEVMRGHYASLVEEVVRHLSRLKGSLETTLAEEERLKQQVYHVQRLAKLLAEDAKVNDDHRQTLATMAPTELERYIDSRIRPGATAANATVPSPTSPTKLNGEGGAGNAVEGSASNISGPSNEEIGGKTAPRESAESLAGVLSEVRRAHNRVEARNATEQTDRTRHMMASMKVDMLQDMIEERAAARREQERREKWRQYNAATAIKNWWRKVNPPEWEDEDRQYAATLIQANIRGKIARIKRKRLLEKFRMTRGATMLQNMYRRYLAVRERRRRARIVKLALGAGLRTLGRAMNELEAKAAALQACEQSSKKRGTKTSGVPDGSPPSPALPATECTAEAVARGAGEKPEEGSVSSLVARLKALEHVLEQQEERHRRELSVDVEGEHGSGGWRNSAASVNSSTGGARGVAKRRR
ncbi:unnamed protein product [Ectocarpus fasciculatus]